MAEMDMNDSGDVELEFEADEEGTVELREATTNAPIHPVADKEADAAAFRSIFDQATTRGAGAIGGKSVVRRREITFVIDGGVGMLRADGAPVFSDEDGNVLDVRIRMRSLTSAEERGVIKKVAGNPGSAPFELAKAALFSACGEKLDDAKKEWLWEVLGPGGRNLCVIAYNMIGGASATVMGKYQASISLG